MITNDQWQLVTNAVNESQLIVVILPEKPDLDQVASGVSLTMALEKLGKSVSVICSEAVLNSSLIGLERIVTELQNKQLQVSFDYSPDAIDKVSYHIDEVAQKFVLVIQPQRGKSPLPVESMKASYSGAEADLVILIGATNLNEDLGTVAEQYKNLLETVRKISFCTYDSKIGDINLNVSGSSSISEALVPWLSQLGLLDADTGTNLLAGIENSTQNLQSLVATADTFSNVSTLMRVGARRLRSKSGQVVSESQAREVVKSMPARKRAASTAPQSESRSASQRL